MSEEVTDPKDPRLTHGVDDHPMYQAEAYLVLSEEERAKGFVRPVRSSYYHVECEFHDGDSPEGPMTTMRNALAETYACNPKFYGSTYCTTCRKHRPVSEFRWLDGSVVGS